MLTFILAAMTSLYIADYAANQNQGHGLFEQREHVAQHWLYQDYEPHLQQNMHEHRVTWKDPNWDPKTWNQEIYHTQSMIERFQRAGLVKASYFDENGYVPIVEIGENFYRLSNQDKSNVLSYVNYAYDITNSYGMFVIRDWHSGRPVGTFTRNGLYLN